MYQYKGIDDTIAAIATALGEASIGVVRISGPDTFAIAEQIFKSKDGSKVSQYKSFSVHYGWIRSKKDEIIDEVLLTVMRSPKTYTTEDMIEINCHGGIVAVKAVLETLIEHGARLAEPGEFTKRAFLNGRIDLTQAEAVLDIIHSKTDAFLRVSNNQLRGELSQELENIRGLLMDVYVELEAILNFPEDDLDSQARGRIMERLEESKTKIDKLLESSSQGRILKEGIKIVLCGRPNVGKSSLLNILLKEPRAIVSEIAGTTRDTIEETASIGGIPFQLVDTAGILSPRDKIEEEAIKRSHMSIQSADLVLFMIDASQSLSKDDEQLMDLIKDRPTIIVFNKTDLPSCVDEGAVTKKLSKRPAVMISVLLKKGLNVLEETILKEVWRGKPSSGGHILLSNIRHIESLTKGRNFLDEAIQNLSHKASLEVVSEGIKSSVNCLDAVTGKNVDNDLLETIFSQFCIGK